MNIYFGASISLNREMLPIYQKLVKTIQQLGHEVLSEHVVAPHLTDDNWRQSYDPKGLFEREAQRIERADCMVAEVTLPSWGTAFLMEHALEHNKPVLALYYKDAEQPLPMMIEGHPELYVQHYDEESIKVVLEKSLEYFGQMKERKGKLIVIDGGDGSGKTTQTEMLLKYLEKEKIAHNQISFPRYKTSFHGQHVGRFLTGEFGKNDQVSPYLSSLAFALDRLTARGQIIEWLKLGRVVVAARYVSANMAHQGSKLSGKTQKDFLDWIYNMEYKEHKLPKEDLVIYLYVPVETAQRLLAQNKRQVDMADTDIEHQRRSIAMYEELSKKYKHWVMIKCVDEKDELLSKEMIHQKIIRILKDRGIIA